MIPAAPIPDSLVRSAGVEAGPRVGAGAGWIGVAEKRLNELTRTKASGVVVGVAVDVCVGVGVDLFDGRARWDWRRATLVETALLAAVIVDRVGASEGWLIAARGPTVASVVASRRSEPSDARAAATTAVRVSAWDIEVGVSSVAAIVFRGVTVATAVGVAVGSGVGVSVGVGVRVGLGVRVAVLVGAAPFPGGTSFTLTEVAVDSGDGVESWAASIENTISGLTRVSSRPAS